MKLVILSIFSTIFFIALIFSVLNFHLVEINLGITSVSLPLTVVLTLELFAGIVIGLLAAFFQIIRLKSDYAQLNKKLDRTSKK
jgi:uncharacterized integral membrane protein